MKILLLFPSHHQIFFYFFEMILHSRLFCQVNCLAVKFIRRLQYAYMQSILVSTAKLIGLLDFDADNE